MKPAVRRVVAPIVGVVAFGLLWELFVRALDVRRFILLPPSTILGAIGDDFGFYVENTLVTARHLVVGLAISLVVAMAAGGAMAASRFLEEASQPVLVLILVTPWVAYITSVVLWLDGGDPTIIFMVAFTTFPVFTFGVVGGMKSTDPAARELFASVNASPWEIFFRLRLPSAIPSILTTARTTIGLGLAAAYFAEGSALTTEGLGAIGKRAASFNDSETLWSTIVMSALLGVAGLAVLTLAERILLRWHASQRR